MRSRKTKRLDAEAQRVADPWATLSNLERQFFQKLIEATDQGAVDWSEERSAIAGVDRCIYKGHWGGSLIRVAYSVGVDQDTVLTRRFGPLDTAIDEHLQRAREQRRAIAEQERVTRAQTAMTRLLGLPPTTTKPSSDGPDVDAIIKDLDEMINHGS